MVGDEYESGYYRAFNKVWGRWQVIQRYCDAWFEFDNEEELDPADWVILDRVEFPDENPA